MIVHGEVETGLVGSSRVDEESESWRRIVAGFELLDVTREVAEVWAVLRALLKRSGLTTGDNDLLIAATALVHDMIVVTRNAKHYARVPGLGMLVLDELPQRRR